MKNIIAFGLAELIKPAVRLVNPLGYLDFQCLVKYARIVVTDSGGIQEETTFLDVQCITVRNNTERPVTVEVGTNQLCGTDLNHVADRVNQVLSGKHKSSNIPQFWDGKAAQRIVDIILERLSDFKIVS